MMNYPCILNSLLISIAISSPSPNQTNPSSFQKTNKPDRVSATPCFMIFDEESQNYLNIQTKKTIHPSFEYVAIGKRWIITTKGDVYANSVENYSPFRLERHSIVKTINENGEQIHPRIAPIPIKIPSPDTVKDSIMLFVGHVPDHVMRHKLAAGNAMKPLDWKAPNPGHVIYDAGSSDWYFHPTWEHKRPNIIGHSGNPVESPVGSKEEIAAAQALQQWMDSTFASTGAKAYDAAWSRFSDSYTRMMSSLLTAYTSIVNYYTGNEDMGVMTAPEDSDE